MKKFVSVLLCIVLLFGVVGCTEKPKEKWSEDSEETISVKREDHKIKAAYDDVIARYIQLLSDKREGKELSAPGTIGMDAREVAIAEALYGIVESCRSAEAAEGFGYGYKDVDGNGIPELLLLGKYTSLHAIFTLSKGKPILLLAAYKDGEDLKFASDNRFYFVCENRVDDVLESIIYFCRVDGTELAYELVCGKTYDWETMEGLDAFRVIDGERIPLDEYTYFSLTHRYQVSSLAGYPELAKLEMPYVHFPLEDKTADENLPVADFSSYAAIRQTYLKIATCLEEFNSFQWSIGEYDDLFSFPNDLAFEYYAQLLYIAYHGGGSLGYDETDLNGDGVDELVLLKEDYRIGAIFTQKDGVPTLVDAFVFSYHNVWLDEDGLIHADSEGYDELKYGLYEFTKSGEYKQHYSIVVNNYGRYRTKDGTIEPLAFEESLELYYNDYIRYPEPFSANEYTRSVSGLTYTPIAEETEDKAELSADKTWHIYSDLEKTTGLESAFSSTCVTFENLTDTQVDMNVKYVFSYGYPDPDQDNYYLYDSTESYLNFTVRLEQGVFAFDENGMKGTVEFGATCLWIIVEESADERFPVGHYCHTPYYIEESVA